MEVLAKIAATKFVLGLRAGLIDLVTYGNSEKFAYCYLDYFPLNVNFRYKSDSLREMISLGDDAS
jgi:hypothetical protein